MFELAEGLVNYRFFSIGYEELIKTECSSKILPPFGCLQYFTSLTGRLFSPIIFYVHMYVHNFIIKGCINRYIYSCCWTKLDMFFLKNTLMSLMNGYLWLLINFQEFSVIPIVFLIINEKKKYNLYKIMISCYLSTQSFGNNTWVGDMVLLYFIDMRALHSRELL